MTGYVGVDRLMTSDEVADILRCTPRAVAEYRRSGRLAAVRFGASFVYRPADVQAFITDHMTEPAKENQ